MPIYVYLVSINLLPNGCDIITYGKVIFRGLSTIPGVWNITSPHYWNVYLCRSSLFQNREHLPPAGAKHLSFKWFSHFFLIWGVSGTSFATLGLPSGPISAHHAGLGDPASRLQACQCILAFSHLQFSSAPPWKTASAMATTAEFAAWLHRVLGNCTILCLMCV